MESLKQLSCEIPVNCLSPCLYSGVVVNYQDGRVVFILESKHLNSSSYRHGQIQVMEQWAVFFGL